MSKRKKVYFNKRINFILFLHSASKTETLKKYLTLKKETSTTVDYSLYTYSDIQTKWIICEGHLNYRYDQIKLLNISQCNK